MKPKPAHNFACGQLPVPGRTPRRAGGRPTLLTLLAAAAAITATSCKKEAPTALPTPTVEVMTTTTTNVPLTAEFIGQLDSPQNVEVRARVEAFVDKVLFTEGTEVKEGDPLFLLDKKPFLERLAAAKGMLAEANAALNKYRADTNRLTPLANAKAIPLQDLDNAVASVAVGQASVQSAEARVESALIDLGYCELKAPVTGLIGAKQVSVGSLVGKGQPTLMATISTMDPMWFYCAISEVDYLRAERKIQESGRKLGDVPVRLFKADGSEHPDKGRWVFLDRAVDVTTGTLRARAEFPNTKTASTNWVLRPGMFARARIDLKTEKDSILVPQRAVQELQGKNFVWVVGAGDKAARRPVEVGPEIGSDFIILEGLKAGERIVVEGVQKVRDGEPVQPKAAASSAGAAPQAAKDAEAKPAEAKSIGTEPLPPSGTGSSQAGAAPRAGISEATNATATAAAPALANASGAATTSAATAPDRPPDLRLQSIAYRLRNPSAVINGETVQVGDPIAGGRVTEIQRQQVTVRWKDKNLVLELPRQESLAQQGKE